jgi:hypothetical protein
MGQDDVRISTLAVGVTAVLVNRDLAVQLLAAGGEIKRHSAKFFGLTIMLTFGRRRVKVGEHSENLPGCARGQPHL